ncbi:myelin basic protein-like isoform X1 [Antennarius striatus]|uniref:myelin basic protein-like isoform X1 n=1 Tax=Antennarius striatus TaxID=241820 RepID=UPI0035AF378B
MASASSSAQAAFGLGRRKKNPGLLDQIGNFFGGDKKRKSKGSFRGALAPGPQKAAATSQRKRGAENAVVHFFRSIVSPAPPKSRWRRLAAKMGLVGGLKETATKTGLMPNRSEGEPARSSSGAVFECGAGVTLFPFILHRHLGSYNLPTHQ